MPRTQQQYNQADLGREVRRRREASGLTLEQLAIRSGLTPNYIGTIETGKRDPSLTTIQSLARGLGIQPGELFGGVDQLGPAGLEAGLLFDSAPSEVQGAVLQILRWTKAKAPRGATRS